MSSTLMNDHQLSKQTSVFGLHLWIVLGVSAGAAIVLLLFLLTLCISSISKHRKQRTKTHHNKPNPNPNPPPPIPPPVSREIRVDFINLNNRVRPDPVRVEEESDQGLGGQPRIQIEIGKGNHRILFPEKLGGGGGGGGGGRRGEQRVGPGVSHLGWGHWYTMRELEVCTNGFSDGNVIGQGGYGIVYHGVLEDNTRVAVKNLLNTRGQAEKEFELEVEAIGRVRHKNLLRLLGYCAEGAHRILVYEYVNNGNLEQWLHGDVGPYSPLTWEIRMKIVLGTAKALTYLHEGLEPKVVHRDIKSSNILLDKCWNPKVSDFGLAKLLGANTSYINTQVMGTFGYVAPEYANTGMLNERSDVYSFGVLFLELISGRNPVDHNRPQEEVYLVDWVKKMVSNRNPERVFDPKLPEKPSSRALKRALLVALRCVDVDAQKRPKMGNVVHMLEAETQSSINDRRLGKESRVAHHGSPNNESNDTQMTESSDRQQ